VSPEFSRERERVREFLKEHPDLFDRANERQHEDGGDEDMAEMLEKPSPSLEHLATISI